MTTSNNSLGINLEKLSKYFSISNKMKFILCVGIIFISTIIIDVLATFHIGGLDDAYITYTFARNLAQGHGIVWSIGGTPVYGSTTITYTILLSLFGYFGFPIPTVSIFLGAIFWGLSNVILYFLMKDRLGLKPAFFAAMLSAISLKALNLSYGMETAFYTFLVVSAFFLYSKSRFILTSIAAALLLLTRLDGILAFALIIGHFLINDGFAKRRSRIFAKLMLPAVAILIPCAILLYLYFGNFLPNSFFAKRLFGSSVSGLFFPGFYWDILQIREASIGLILTIIFFIFIFIGVIILVLKWRDTKNLVFIWLIAYLAMYIFGNMPHSPWYYAPAIPVMYISYVSGAIWMYDLADNFIQSSNKYYSTFAKVSKYMILILLILYFIFTAQASYRQIETDKFGEHIYKNEERRILSDVVLNDMKQRNVSNTSLMAFEVGFFGYNIPGEIHDILGLVSPDVLKNGGMKNPTYILDKYKPEYAVIVDTYGYPPTTPIYQSFEFQSNYKELYSLPRPFGHNYKVFHRDQVQMQNIWNFDVKTPPATVHQINILDNNGLLVLESTGNDPYLVYDNLQTREFTNGILCMEVYSSNAGIFEVFLNFGNNSDDEKSLKFLLTSNAHSLCSKIPDGKSIFGLRIDPIGYAGKVTINNISIWEPK